MSDDDGLEVAPEPDAATESTATIEASASVGPTGDPDAPVFRVMNVESVLFDLSDPSPMIHMVEAEVPFRYLPIPIALAEAQALHNALLGVEGRRPTTHELLSAMLARLNCDVIAVRIVRYEGGVFYAELDVMSPRGRETFDARPSDAIIVATRQRVAAPVLCAEAVFAEFFD